MPKMTQSGEGLLLPNLKEQQAVSRRKFLGYGAVAFSIGDRISACNKN